MSGCNDNLIQDLNESLSTNKSSLDGIFSLLRCSSSRSSVYSRLDARGDVELTSLFFFHLQRRNTLRHHHLSTGQVVRIRCFLNKFKIQGERYFLSILKSHN